MNEEAFYHWVLMDFNTVVEGNDVKQVLHDLKKFYPDTFEKVVEAIKYEDRIL